MAEPTPTDRSVLSARRLRAGDAARFAAALSIVVGGIWVGQISVPLFLLVLAGTMVPRRLGAPAAPDLPYGLVLLVAAWAGQLGWYDAVGWLDLAVHAVATGLIAIVAHLALVRAGVLVGLDPARVGRPRASTVIVTTALGATLAVVWEIAEWFGHTSLDAGIFVGYEDTIGDLAAGLLGALAAGALVSRRDLLAPPRPGSTSVATVSVVVPVRDDAAQLERCLTLLAAQVRAPLEIIVVDNGSLDDSAAVAARLGARVVVESRPGIPAAAAAGYDAARGEVIARLDADSRPGPRWVEQIGTRMGTDTTLDALTGTGRFVDLPRGLGTLACATYLGSYYLLAHLALAHTPVWGSSMAVRRSTWEQVRSQVQRDDSEVHDDLDLSFSLGPRRRTRIDRALRVGVSGRSLRGGAQRRRRLRRAWRTLALNWAIRPPWTLWWDRLDARRAG